MALTGEAFYADARVYDLLFPGGDAGAAFYRAEAARVGGSVLELGCGTGHKLIPIAADGAECVGLDASPSMLAEARRKANAAGVDVTWVHGDMADFDLGRSFDLVTIPGNSLLHLHDPAAIASCFAAVARHLAPGGRLAFDVFNPSVQILAAADGTRRPRESLTFTDPERGEVRVDVTETYDAATQVTRGTWWFSTDAEPDLAAVRLEIRSVFPQELPLLLELGGLRLVERWGGWSRSPFGSDSPQQLCVAETAT